MTETPGMFDGLAQIGGHPALDFLNTVKYRGRSEPGERLCGFLDVIDWAESAGIVARAEARALRGMVAGDPNKSRRVFSEILAFREDLRCMLGEYTTQRRTAAAAAVEKALYELRLTARIDITNRTLARYVPVNHMQDLKHRVVQAAADLLEMSPRPPLASCAADDCDWLFLDRSKAGRRRWCDTRTCGNRARVRRFRRQTAAMTI